MRFSVEEICQAVSGNVCSMGKASFGGVSTDTRKVKAGDFVTVGCKDKKITFSVKKDDEK